MKTKILLIDDDHYYRQLISAIFLDSYLNFTSRSEFFGPAEFSQIPTYDLIILDHHLHPKTGMQLAEFLWQFYTGVSVIIVSADKSKLLREQSQRLPNIREIVDKELGPHKLLNVVGDIVKNQINLDAWQTYSIRR